MAAMEPRYWNRQTLKRNREGRRGKRTRKTHAIVPPHRAQSAAEVDITRDGQFLLGEGAAGRRLRRRSPRDRPRRGKTAILFHRLRGVLPISPGVDTSSDQLKRANRCLKRAQNGSQPVMVVLLLLFALNASATHSSNGPSCAANRASEPKDVIWRTPRPPTSTF